MAVRRKRAWEPPARGDGRRVLIASPPLRRRDGLRQRERDAVLTRHTGAPTLASMPGPDIVLYDGVCGLCNGAVRFVLPRDPAGRFRFAPLQSAWAREVLRRHGRNPDDLDTVYVVRNAGQAGEELLARTDATVYVARALGGAWRLATLLNLLPSRLRDALYDAVARRRYRLFGRHDACVLPRPEWRARFIDV